MGFILVVDAVPEGLTPGIENYRQMCAGVVLQQPGEHVAEAINRIHMHTIGALHVWYGVEGPEDETGAVD